MRFVSFLKTWRSICGLGLFFLSTLIAVISLPEGFNVSYKVGALLLALVLFTATQYYTSSQLSEDEAKEQTYVRLKCVDTLRMFTAKQNPRSNIFRWNKKAKAYFIWQHHRMDTDMAPSVTRIPKGEGCTGHAWEEKRQIWAAGDEIKEGGRYALPASEEQKLQEIPAWICSTPVVNKKQKVIAVLNFDGNEPVTDETTKKHIMMHATRVATEVGEVLCRL